MVDSILTDSTSYIRVIHELKNKDSYGDAWIITLLICIITIIANLYISGRQIRNSRINLNKEIDSKIDEIKKNKLADFRQAWIDELRNLISEMLAIHQLTGELLRNRVYEFDIYDLLQKTIKIQYKIEMMLNSNEEKSRLLIEEIRLLNARNILDKNEHDDEKYSKSIDTILDLSKSIFKTEWERIKRLE
ncbi:MAG: hypothetical protein PHT25_00750 [Bacteroidales bacterium]|nr:hypothetical protein [Bacteroidales bacterium]